MATMFSRLKVQPTGNKGEMKYERTASYYDTEKQEYYCFNQHARLISLRETERHLNQVILGRDPYSIGCVRNLMDNLDDNNQIVIKVSRRGLSPVSDKKDLNEIMGASEKKGPKILKTLLENDVIRKDTALDGSGASVYFMNPLYLLQSKGLKLSLYRIFHDSINECLKPYTIYQLCRVSGLELPDKLCISVSGTEVYVDGKLADTIDANSQEAVDDFIISIARKPEDVIERPFIPPSLTADDYIEMKQEEERQPRTMAADGGESSLREATQEIEQHPFNKNDEIFRDFVLNGGAETESPEISDVWHFAEFRGKTSLFRGYRENNVNVYFTPNRIKSGYRRTKEHVAEYNNCYVDIDIGKDESGNYLPLADVHNRKVELRRSVISQLPRYTALVETRNGFHVYWSLNADTTREDWQETELAIVDVLTFSDPAVKDPNRVLRMPLSIHKKDGTLPFVVTVVDAHEIRYACAELKQEFEQHAGAIRKACEGYLEDYPEVMSNNQGNQRRTSSVSIPKENNRRVEEIMKLRDDDSRKKPELQHMTKEEFIEFVHHQDLQEFLGVGDSNPFRCVFPDHEDNHPSAGILTGGSKQVYYCSCTGKPLDIFDVVQEIAGCEYREAARYLNKHYNVKITG